MKLRKSTTENWQLFTGCCQIFGPSCVLDVTTWVFWTLSFSSIRTRRGNHPELIAIHECHVSHIWKVTWMEIAARLKWLTNALRNYRNVYVYSHARWMDYARKRLFPITWPQLMLMAFNYNYQSFPLEAFTETLQSTRANGSHGFHFHSKLIVDQTHMQSRPCQANRTTTQRLYGRFWASSICASTASVSIWSFITGARSSSLWSLRILAFKMSLVSLMIALKFSSDKLRWTLGLSSGSGLSWWTNLQYSVKNFCQVG